MEQCRGRRGEKVEEDEVQWRLRGREDSRLNCKGTKGSMALSEVI